MSATGLDVFDRTLNITHAWLNEITGDLGCDRQTAWHVLGAVLHALRDRVPADLAAHLGAELPLLIRGLFYEGYRPTAQPEPTRTLDAFLDQVRPGLNPASGVGPREAVVAVSRVLARHIDAGQGRKIWEALPQDVRALGNDADLA